MTPLEEIKRMNCAVITPNTAARVIGCDPNYIRVVARENPEDLPYPTFRIGNRTKIPRLPFIHYMETGAAT